MGIEDCAPRSAHARVSLPATSASSTTVERYWAFLYIKGCGAPGPFQSPYFLFVAVICDGRSGPLRLQLGRSAWLC